MLQVAQGIINAFDTPARQAFVVEMVEDRADLPNAIALNSTMVNGSRIIGPSIGGVLIAAVGEGWCFSSTPSRTSRVHRLAARDARRAHEARRTRRTRVLDELKAGFRYVAASRADPHRAASCSRSSASMAMPYTVLMPAIAANVAARRPAHARLPHDGDRRRRARRRALPRVARDRASGSAGSIVHATLAFGVGLIVLRASRGRSGCRSSSCRSSARGFMVQMASTNTILQTIVEERLRGRVMAFYTMAFLGTAPIGSLARRRGRRSHRRAGDDRASAASACIVGGLWFACSPARDSARIVRPIYIERGIIAMPDMDSGPKTATL